MNRLWMLLPAGAFLVIAAWTMALNVGLQHYLCDVPWKHTDPLEFIPCDPVDQVLLEQEELRRLARLHPYCEPKDH